MLSLLTIFHLRNIFFTKFSFQKVIWFLVKLETMFFFSPKIQSPNKKCKTVQKALDCVHVGISTLVNSNTHPEWSGWLLPSSPPPSEVLLTLDEADQKNVDDLYNDANCFVGLWLEPCLDLKTAKWEDGPGKTCVRSFSQQELYTMHEKIESLEHLFLVVCGGQQLKEPPTSSGEFNFRILHAVYVDCLS